MEKASEIPLITDTTELITPDVAREMLQKNDRNRPINWMQVEKYAALMKDGEWRLHPQGIVLDPDNNILTGQQRLWGVVYADIPIYFRVSRGTSPDAARFMDRGRPQTARDLAARETGRKHSPTELNLARAIMAIDGDARPSTDDLSVVIESYSDKFAELLVALRGTKKTREVMMLLAAASVQSWSADQVTLIARLVEVLRDRLLPRTAQELWGKGSGFCLAMRTAVEVVKEVQISEEEERQVS